MNTRTVETFRVMVGDQTLNRIERVDNERESDPIEARIERRRLDAVHKAQRWQASYYKDETVRVVPCDGQNNPI